jgi:hypothetical protein
VNRRYKGVEPDCACAPPLNAIPLDVPERAIVASESFEKFRQSMSIGYAEWHDGIGYDLNAISALPPEERLRAEDLVSHKAK